MAVSSGSCAVNGGQVDVDASRNLGLNSGSMRCILLQGLWQVPNLRTTFDHVIAV